MAQDIAEAHVRPGATKGFVLGQMLDAHDALKDSPQGQSFFGFRELLLAPDRQEHFEKAIGKAGTLVAIDPELRSNPLLTELITRLLVEDETVLTSTQRVSSNLRRVLDTSDLSERRRVASLVKEIAAIALRAKESINHKESCFDLPEMPVSYAGMSRPLWRDQKAIVALDDVEIEDDDSMLEELRRFRNLPQVRLSELRNNVDTCLGRQDNIILASILAEFPPKNGIIDVIGYLIIAAQEDRHYLGEDDVTQIELPSGDRWSVPAVLFTRGVSA